MKSTFEFVFIYFLMTNFDLGRTSKATLKLQLWQKKFTVKNNSVKKQILHFTYIYFGGEEN